mmetsp:Transcript_4054/g.16962  ORF Transcript_4054/g.16962 Transcript_4054/m.16962 type:complete len:221 (-) Transcript_4054:1261-1923(-)
MRRDVQGLFRVNGLEHAAGEDEDVAENLGGGHGLGAEQARGGQHLADVARREALEPAHLVELGDKHAGHLAQRRLEGLDAAEGQAGGRSGLEERVDVRLPQDHSADASAGHSRDLRAEASEHGESAHDGPPGEGVDDPAERAVDVHRRAVRVDWPQAGVQRERGRAALAGASAGHGALGRVSARALGVLAGRLCGGADDGCEVRLRVVDPRHADGGAAHA